MISWFWITGLITGLGSGSGVLVKNDYVVTFSRHKSCSR